MVDITRNNLQNKNWNRCTASVPWTSWHSSLARSCCSGPFINSRSSVGKMATSSLPSAPTASWIRSRNTTFVSAFCLTNNCSFTSWEMAERNTACGSCTVDIWNFPDRNKKPWFSYGSFAVLLGCDEMARSDVHVLLDCQHSFSRPRCSLNQNKLLLLLLLPCK